MYFFDHVTCSRWSFSWLGHKVKDRLYRFLNLRSQTTVENCIGGHVNVLSDYKKT